MLLEQYPQHKTGGISTAQGMFLADFSEVVVGQFTEGFEVIVNPFILDKEGLIRITITSLCDIQFKHKKSFQQITVSWTWEVKFHHVDLHADKFRSDGFCR